MKYSNGDMDDLFRRASERYPLQTDSADWDRLANALDREPAAPSAKGEKPRKRGVFWWLLLIPLAGIGYLTWQVRVHHSLDRGIVAAQTGGNAVKAGNAVTNAGSVASGGSGSGISGDRATRAASGDRSASGASGNGVSGDKEVRKLRTPDDSVVNVSAAQNSVVPGRQYIARSPGTDNRASGAGKVRSLRTSSSSGSGSGRVEAGTGSQTAEAGSGRQMVDAGTGKRFPGQHSRRITSSAKTSTAKPGGSDGGPFGGAGANSGLVAGGGLLTGGGHQDPMLAILDLSRAPIGGGYDVVVDVVAPPIPAKGSAPGSKHPAQKKSHGYIGISAAPDFSTVRFQKMTGVGTTFGLLLGYSFNDRWAVESGLYMDRKRYYTDGEYFNTKNVRVPPYTTLLNVDGTCYMWEIPVNVRYNFSTGPRMKWFGTAGLSTYLMSKEKYSYEYKTNSGIGDSLWNIHKPSQYWFSIINLSAGFEQRIGKVGYLRLEPYARIPLSGIGTGKLSILSVGVNIGFTRQLW